MTDPNQVPPPPLPAQPGGGAGGTPPVQAGPFAAQQPGNQQVFSPQQGQADNQGHNPSVLHQTEQTRTYPCPNCGGELRFDPQRQGLLCRACGALTALDPQVLTAQPIPKYDLGQAMERLRALQSQAQAAISLDKEIVCQSCGGHSIFTGTVTTLRCPYCNTPIARDDVHDAPTRLPIDGILPLRVPEHEARTQIEKWINSRWFAPNAFKKYRELGTFTSIYLPYYSYDAATTTDYEGQRGIHRTETYTDGEGHTHSRTVTDWYYASGRVNTSFVDVTGNASQGLNDAKVQELEPWPLDQTCAYSPHIAAGHLTRTYDYEADQVFSTRVQPRMENSIDADIRHDIGGNEQRITWRGIHWHYIRFCHLALPIWMLTVTFKNQPFNVVINGLTGEVQGERPYSAIKITLAVIAGIILATIIAYFISREN